MVRESEIGHEKLCAMSWLTQNTLKEGGVQQDVIKNVTVQTPTGDMLVNQLRTGSLDAAFTYLRNAAGSAEYPDAIRVKDWVSGLIIVERANRPVVWCEWPRPRHIVICQWPRRWPSTTILPLFPSTSAERRTSHSPSRSAAVHE